MLLEFKEWKGDQDEKFIFNHYAIWLHYTRFGISGYGINPSQKDTKIAIIPIGYADGLSRVLGNGNGKVLINGEIVPTIGNICMDMTMIDISGININVGDRVELFGENLKIQELAREMNSIPYEVLSSISERVVRIYTED